jgi:hypothetical protein
MSEEKEKVPYRVSPVVIADHPWINKADTKYNKAGLFHLDGILDPSDPMFDDFKTFLDTEAEAAFQEIMKEVPAKDRKKWKVYKPYTEETDEADRPTGRIIVEFKQNAVIKLRDGTVKEVVIGIHDAKDRPVDVPIFSGTELRVLYKPRVIKVASGNMAGVRLDFAKVQIIKLAEKTGGGGQGFGEVEGGWEGADKRENKDRSRGGELDEEIPF